MPDNNIRARLADALFPYLLYPSESQKVADVLLSLPGIAITEVPICTCPASTLFSGSVGHDCPEHGVGNAMETK